MPREYTSNSSKIPVLPPEVIRQRTEERSRREHEQAVRSDIETLDKGVRGGQEPYPGEFKNNTRRLGALQQNGDPIVEQILSEHGSTADTIRALLNNPVPEEGETDVGPRHTIENKPDGTIVIENPTPSVIIVSLTLGLSSHEEGTRIRLSPGQRVEIKPVISSHVQTKDEWADEGDPEWRQRQGKSPARKLYRP